MILTGKQILHEVSAGRITISPFNSAHISTNSYDLTLGNTFIRYTDEVIDPQKDNHYETIIASRESPIFMDKGDFLLWSSLEKIWSSSYVPIIHNKSSIARMWLFVHITADLIDIGSIWTTTFQLYATLPITLYPGMLLWQVSFWKTHWDIKLYEWKYQNSNGPVASRTFIDFHNKYE